jgi:lysophospholipase L1-like esterase
MDTPQPGGPLERLLSPWALLLGVVASFLGCCAAGAWYTRHNVYASFDRFHPWIAPETLHYPSAGQVMALARSRLDRDKVAVIVGGNSVLHGVGQRAELLWTKALQARLGDDYRVINLAMRGASPAEFGGVVAEALSGEYRKMVYVTLTGFGGGGPPDGFAYQYLYWDAWGRGLLREYPGREEGLRYYAMAAQRDPARMEELARQGRVNAYLYFNDLWNALAYTRLSLVWHPGACTHMFRPRKRYTDPDLGPPPLAHRYPPALEAVESTRLHGWVRNGRAMIRGYHLSPGQPDVLDPARSPMCQELSAAFPEPFRARTLLLIHSDSPHYLKQLTPTEQEAYHDLALRQVRVLEKAGFAALEVSHGYTEEDFVDRGHLSESGGLRLAAEVAPKIREMARRLGYLGEGGKP